VKADPESADRFARELGLKKNEMLFVAGSTHPGEEEIIVEALKNWQKDFSGLRLLIAPRHVERAKEVRAMLKQYGPWPLDPGPRVFILIE